MLQIDKVPYADHLPKIIIKPSNNLFSELGKSDYSFLDLISEFIDNSISARSSSIPLKIDIELNKGVNRSDSCIIIRDNSIGIDRTILPLALSPGEYVGNSNLNEHGLGMKQAIHSMGELKYIATKTIHDSQAIVIEQFQFEEAITPKLISVDWDQGTEICVHFLKDIVPLKSIAYTTRIVPYLGARYRKFLTDQSNPIIIHFYLKDSVNNKLKRKWLVKEIQPVYFHPITKKNKPVIKNHKFKGRNWEVSFSMGYAPKDEPEYNKLGLNKPKNYEPYSVSINHQGFDILINDRVINFHQLKEINLVAFKSKRFNIIRGEIHLLKGFTTTITKNQIIRNAFFNDMIHQLKEFIERHKLLHQQLFDHLPQPLLRERLLKYIQSKMNDPSKIKTNYLIKGLGKLAILANDKAWDVLEKKVRGLEIYQFFSFLDMGQISEGYLYAPEFEDSAHHAVEFIRSKHNKLIHLLTLNDQMSQPPNEDEIKKYY